MTTSTKKAPAKVIVIKAPKIVTAWANVCKVSNKSEQEVFASIVNLHEVLTNESRLSVADKKKFIKGLEEGGAVSSFIKASHVPAIPTLMNLHKLHKDYAALPIAKQLSLAMASYDILGVGKGEQFKTLDALTKEISTVRKAKTSKAKEGATTPKKAKATMAETLRAAIALVNSIGDGVEDEVYDLLLELADAAAVKVGVSA
jgi:hypothetical protein